MTQANGIGISLTEPRSLGSAVFVSGAESLFWFQLLQMLVPFRFPLVGICDAQDQLFLPRLADDLQTGRAPGRRETARNRDRRLAGEIERKRVIQIHAN